MAQGDTPITLVGNLTTDPELRFTPSGAAVANFTVASTPRTYNRDTSQWEDGEAMFLDCSVWRQAAENVAESLSKGMRVIVTGRLKQRRYTDKDGNNRSSFEVDVDEVGPSLKWATATVDRGQPNSNVKSGQDWSQAGQQARQSAWAGAQQASTQQRAQDAEAPF